MRLTPTEIITMLVGLTTAAATYFQGRKHGQGSFINAVHEAAHIVIKDLRAECDRLRGQHNDCEHKLMSMQEQIDALMRASPAAIYRPGE